jgi:D-alanine transaminase
MVVYLNGEFMEKAEARLSPDDRGFLFGDGVYEVIRAYEGLFFEAPAHARRLRRSLLEARIEWPELDSMTDIGETLLEKNALRSGQALYYLQVTRGAAPRSHPFPPAETRPTAYACVSPFSATDGDLQDGIEVITVSDPRWGRCDIKTIALMPNVMALQRGLDSGAREVIFVRDGVVTEGSHNNFFGVFDGVVTTAPRSNTILAGITRAVVLDLCRELDLSFAEESIPEDRICSAQELFICGTGSEITPVVRVDGHPIAGGDPGPLTRTLQEAFGRRVAALIPS